MKRQVVHGIATLCVLLIVGGYVWWMLFGSGGVFRVQSQNAGNRAALVQIHRDIAVGATHGEVLAAYWQHRTDELRLRADSPTEWWISMPLEPGASDWTLELQFAADRVAVVRMSTSNGTPPEGGPPDKR